MSATRRFAFAAALALVSVFSAPACRSDDIYRLQRVPKVSDTDKYRFDIQVEGQRGEGGAVNVVVMITTTEAVKELKSNGSYVVLTTIDSGTIKVMGADRPFAGAGQALTVTFDKGGAAIRKEGNGGGPLVEAILDFARFNLIPDEGLKLGEERAVERQSGKDNKQSAAGTVTAVSVERPGPEIKVQTVKVKSAGDITQIAPTGPQKIHIESVAFIEPNTGRLYKNEGKATAPMIGPLKNCTITFKLSRVANGDADKQ